ncbi:methyltransferase [Pseudomonas sp. Marseille-QA0892]
MDARSEVLLRQVELFANGPLLLAGLPADDLLARLPLAQGWSWHAGDHRYLTERFDGRCVFGTELPLGDSDGAVLFLPKSRELGEYLMAALASRLEGKRLYVVGEKRGGIERVSKQLAAFGTPSKVDNARHCQLWQVRVDTPPQPPALDALAQRFEVPTQDGALTVISLPGVFAHGRLDRGTQLLLEHLDALPQGHFLDFGCGAGIVGSWLKRRYEDSQVSLLDVDAFALQASRLTLAANGLEAEVIAGDGIAAAPRDLAAIVSNPPFHQGVHTSYRASEDLLRQARAHLNAHGELRIVANSFLAYPPLIEQHLGPCSTLAERDGFRIYKAVSG